MKFKSNIDYKNGIIRGLEKAKKMINDNDALLVSTRKEIANQINEEISKEKQ